MTLSVISQRGDFESDTTKKNEKSSTAVTFGKLEITAIERWGQLGSQIDLIHWVVGIIHKRISRRITSVNQLHISDTASENYWPQGISMPLHHFVPRLFYSSAWDFYTCFHCHVRSNKIYQSVTLAGGKVVQEIFVKGVSEFTAKYEKYDRLICRNVLRGRRYSTS